MSHMIIKGNDWRFVGQTVELNRGKYMKLLLEEWTEDPWEDRWDHGPKSKKSTNTQVPQLTAQNNNAPTATPTQQLIKALHAKSVSPKKYCWVIPSTNTWTNFYIVEMSNNCRCLCGAQREKYSFALKCFAQIVFKMRKERASSFLRSKTITKTKDRLKNIMENVLVRMERYTGSSLYFGDISVKPLNAQNVQIKSKWEKWSRRSMILFRSRRVKIIEISEVVTNKKLLADGCRVR